LLGHAPSLHWVTPPGHIAAHVPPLQTCPDGHAAQLGPQWVTSEATHAPPHDTRPPAHWQAPAWHVSLAPHAFPHVPQFWGSEATFLQEPLHDICPAAHIVPLVPPVPAFPELGMQASDDSATADSTSTANRSLMVMLPRLSFVSIPVSNRSINLFF
jgi:hypothetical protein